MKYEVPKQANYHPGNNPPNCPEARKLWLAAKAHRDDPRNQIPKDPNARLALLKHLQDAVNQDRVKAAKPKPKAEEDLTEPVPDVPPMPVEDDLPVEDEYLDDEGNLIEETEGDEEPIVLTEQEKALADSMTFECELCGKPFKGAQQLTGHLITCKKKHNQE